MMSDRRQLNISALLMRPSVRPATLDRYSSWPANDVSPTDRPTLGPWTPFDSTLCRRRRAARLYVYIRVCAGDGVSTRRRVASRRRLGDLLMTRASSLHRTCVEVTLRTEKAKTRAQFPRNILVTRLYRNVCYEEVTRKLLPWKLV